MKETWKDIKGFEGLYQVSNLGNVKSLERITVYVDGRQQAYPETQLKPFPQRQGYLLIALYKNGKRNCKTIHRLVAGAFIPNPCECREVNHKDEDKQNNLTSNLEWCSSKYNVNYGTRTKRATENTDHIKKGAKLSIAVKQINYSGNVINVYYGTKEAQRQTGVWQSNIVACCKGKKDNAGGYRWEYA